MRQLDAIEIITNVIKEDSAVRAMFLKGSIARNQMDQYSDVDFYCLVKEEELEDFLSRRLSYLKEYMPLVYWSESNFVGPQIVAVFENGLHFDLYSVTIKSLSKTDEIKVIHDPENLLKDYNAEKLTIGKDSFLEFFDEFSFCLLEFEAAFHRNDLLWASRLAQQLSGYVSMTLRYLYDYDNARLGSKRLHQTISEDLKTRLSTAIDLSGPSYLPKGVIQLIEMMKEIIENNLGDDSDKINRNFFYFMSGRINALEGQSESMILA